MDKKILLLIGISSLIISLSIAYYFVIFLPEKEKNRVELAYKEFTLDESKENRVAETQNADQLQAEQVITDQQLARQQAVKECEKEFGAKVSAFREYIKAGPYAYTDEELEAFLKLKTATKSKEIGECLSNKGF